MKRATKKTWSIVIAILLAMALVVGLVACNTTDEGGETGGFNANVVNLNSETTDEPSDDEPVDDEISSDDETPYDDTTNDEDEDETHNPNVFRGGSNAFRLPGAEVTGSIAAPGNVGIGFPDGNTGNTSNPTGNTGNPGGNTGGNPSGNTGNPAGNTGGNTDGGGNTNPPTTATLPPEIVTEPPATTPAPVNPSAGRATSMSPGLIDQTAVARQALVNAGFSVTDLQGGFSVSNRDADGNFADISFVLDGNLFGFVQLGSNPTEYVYSEVRLGRGETQSVTAFEGSFWLQQEPVALSSITLGTTSMTRINDGGGYGWLWTPSQPVSFVVPNHVTSLQAWDPRSNTTGTFSAGQRAYVGLDGAAIWFTVSA